MNSQLRRSAAFSLLLLLALSGLAWAHHQPQLDDLQHITTIKGVVTSFEYVNPHCMLHLAVKMPDGKTEDWTAELAPPATLHTVGWGKDSLKPGDHITVTGHKNKGGSNLLTVRTVILSNGQQLNQRLR
jgi:hypothetical protein